MLASWLQSLNSLQSVTTLLIIWAAVVIIANARRRALDECFAELIKSYSMEVHHDFTHSSRGKESLTFFYFAEGYERVETVQAKKELSRPLSPLSRFSFGELLNSFSRLGKKENEFILTPNPGGWRARKLNVKTS